jgi:hypothetical protein
MALYLEALSALELSSLGHLARHSAWAFMLANVLHVLGAALLVGAIAVFDSALVFGRYAGGIALQVPTGLILLAAEATKLGINPAFYAKMTFLLIGLANVAVFHGFFGRSLRTGIVDSGARTLAIVSLAAWILTLVAGRLIAYL